MTAKNIDANMLIPTTWSSKLVEKLVTFLMKVFRQVFIKEESKSDKCCLFDNNLHGKSALIYVFNDSFKDIFIYFFFHRIIQME